MFYREQHLPENGPKAVSLRQPTPSPHVATIRSDYEDPMLLLEVTWAPSSCGRYGARLTASPFSVLTGKSARFTRTAIAQRTCPRVGRFAGGIRRRATFTLLWSERAYPVLIG